MGERNSIARKNRPNSFAISNDIAKSQSPSRPATKGRVRRPNPLKTVQSRVGIQARKHVGGRGKVLSETECLKNGSTSGKERKRCLVVARVTWGNWQPFILFNKRNPVNK